MRRDDYGIRNNVELNRDEGGGDYGEEEEGGGDEMEGMGVEDLGG